MASKFDIVFAFKQHDGDEVAAKIISELRSHPAIWAVILKELEYLRIDNDIRRENKRWNLITVIDFFRNHNALSESQNDLIPQTGELQKIIQSIDEAEGRLHQSTWQEIINDDFWKNDENLEISHHWGTVFSYFYEKGNSKNDLEKALINDGENGLKVIAFLFKIRAIQEIKGFVIRNLETLKDNPEKVALISDTLRMFNAEEIRVHLIEHYLDAIGEQEFSRDVTDQTRSQDQIDQMRQYITLSALAESIDAPSRAHGYRSKAKDVFDNLAKPVQDEAERDISILEKARNIAEVDKQTAREMCQNWLEAILSNHLDRSILRMHSPILEKTISLFEFLDLHFETVLFLEKLLAVKGKNCQIEKKIGDLCAAHGDRARVIQYFQPLFGEDKLTRDQKIALANAYASNGEWDAALAVLTSVNAVCLNDELTRLSFELHSGREVSLEKRVADFSSSYPDSRTIEIIQNSLRGVEIQSSEFNSVQQPELDHLIDILFHLISKLSQPDRLAYLAKIKEVSDRASYLYYKNFSDTLPDLEAESLLNTLFIEERITNQDVFESVIEDFFNRGKYSSCEMVISLNADQWPLSQRLQKTKIALALENKAYQQAAKTLSIMTDYFPMDNEALTLFGVFALRSTLKDFPYSHEKHRILEHEREKFSRYVTEIQQDLSTSNQLIQIELNSDQKTRDYLAFGAKYAPGQSRDAWRVPFAIGCHFYQEKKFDQAIIYLAESRKLSKKSSAGLRMLISAYTQLHLYDEAIELISNESGGNREISQKEMKTWADLLYESDSFMNFLSEKQANAQDAIETDLTRVFVMIKRNLEKEAIALLGQIENKISPSDPALLELADLFYMLGKEKSSKRALDTYLSNNQTLTDHAVILASKTFFNLGLHEKSLNILSLVDDSKINIDFARASIFTLLEEIDQAKDALVKGCLPPVRKQLPQVVDSKDLPETWMASDSKYFENVIIHLLKANELENLEGIFKYLMDQVISNENFARALCQIALITGEESYFDQCVKNFSNLSGPAANALAEMEISRALALSHEVEAAMLITKVLHSTDNAPYFQLSQARLQLRQNNRFDAKNKILDCYFDLLKEKTQENGLPEEKLADLVFQIDLAEGLFEAGEYEKSYDLTRAIFKKVGLTRRIMDFFPKVFAHIYREILLNQKLSIKNHTYRLDDTDKWLFGQWIEQAQDSNHLAEEFQSILQHHPNQTTPASEELAEIMSTMAKQGVANSKLYDAVLMIEDEPEQAGELLKKLLMDEPNNPRILFALGMANKNQNDLSGSYIPINLALEIWPDEYEWHQIAAELCEKLRDHLNAARHQNAAFRHHSPDGHPHNFQLIREVIHAFIEEGKEIPSRLMPGVIKHAQDCLVWGDLITARRIITQVRRLNPENIQTNLMFCELLLSERNFEEAGVQLKTILEKNPSDAQANALLLKLFIEQSDLKMASQTLDEMVERDPSLESKLIDVRLKLIENESGMEKSFRFIDQQIEENDDPDLLITASMFLIEHGEYKMAQELINSLLINHVEKADVLLLAANLSNLQGDLDKALAYLSRVITIAPFNTRGYLESAGIFDAKRQYDFAEKILEEGIENNPYDFPLLRFAGKYNEKIGKLSKALEYLKRAYTINSNDLELKDLLYKTEKNLFL